MADPGEPPASARLAALYRARAAHESAAVGYAWLVMADPARALAAWTPILSQSTDPDLLRQAADLALQTDGPALAQATLERLLQLDPGNSRAHLQLGLLVAATNPGTAESHLQAAANEAAYAELAPAVLEAARQSAAAAGWALMQHELWAQAEVAFMQAIAEAPSSPLLLAGLALARDYQGKDGGVWIERAAALGPDIAAVRALQSTHLRLDGDLAGSLQAQITAAGLAPDSPAILAGLAAAYQRTGDLEAARRWSSAALALAGDDPRYSALHESLSQAESAALAALIDALGSGASAGAP